MERTVVVMLVRAVGVAPLWKESAVLCIVGSLVLARDDSKGCGGSVTGYYLLSSRRLFCVAWSMRSGRQSTYWYPAGELRGGEVVVGGQEARGRWQPDANRVGCVSVRCIVSGACHWDSMFIDPEPGTLLDYNLVAGNLPFQIIHSSVHI